MTRALVIGHFQRLASPPFQRYDISRMKHRPRYILALTLVATTLCAQRLFASDGSVRVESKQQSERLVARLTRGLSQAVRQNPLIVRYGITTPPPRPESIATQTDASSPSLSIVQLPLPPPLA
jgi:hypothetical protein